MFHDGPDQFVDPRQEEGGWQAATDEISPFHRPKSHRSSTEATKIDLFPNGVGSIRCSFFSSDVIQTTNQDIQVPFRNAQRHSNKGAWRSSHPSPKFWKKSAKNGGQPSRFDGVL
jgi:hypothetical protein